MSRHCPDCRDLEAKLEQAQTEASQSALTLQTQLLEAQHYSRRLYRAARAHYDNASAENLMVLGDALAEPTP